MFKPKTYAELCNAMENGATIQIDDHVGVINGLQREDGSGRCWIIQMRVRGDPALADDRKIFFRVAT